MENRRRYHPLSVSTTTFTEDDPHLRPPLKRQKLYFCNEDLRNESLIDEELGRLNICASSDGGPKYKNDGICRVALRLPNGQRCQREFLNSDPIQVLWPFCRGLLNGEKEFGCGFQLLLAIPGAIKYLDYQSRLTIEESGVSNSLVSVHLIE